MELNVISSLPKLPVQSSDCVPHWYNAFLSKLNIVNSLCVEGTVVSR